MAVDQGLQNILQAGASSSDILSAFKNIASAVNNVAQTLLQLHGTSNVPNISTATLVKSGAGRVCTISITTAGSATGTIYDTNAATSTLRPIYTIPNTIGVVHIDLATNYGIVVVPGTSQVVTVGFS